MQFPSSVPGTLYRKVFLCGLLFFCTAQPVSAQNNNLPAEKNIETIQIGETTYSIPEPWIGNRIPVPDIAPESFSQIPTAHTKNGSRLYIVEEAHTALVQLLEAAKADGIMLRVESGYRSPAYQKTIFARMLNAGRDFKDIIRYVAPPGYSQHALGTAVDFYPSNWRFASLPEHEWLHQHGAEFGFTETYSQYNALRYPWEAWHWNYKERK